MGEAELVRQGLVRIAARKRQIATLRAELASLAQKNRHHVTVNRAELMGSAWHKLQHAIYMLGLLDKAVRQLRQAAMHQSNPHLFNTLD